MSQELKFVVKYVGGDADNHKIDLYDDCKVNEGISPCLSNLNACT